LTPSQPARSRAGSTHLCRRGCAISPAGAVRSTDGISRLPRRIGVTGPVEPREPLGPPEHQGEAWTWSLRTSRTLGTSIRTVRTDPTEVNSAALDRADRGDCLQLEQDDDGPNPLAGELLRPGRDAGGAELGSRSPWSCRIGRAAASRPQAWRTRDRSTVAPSADHAGSRRKRSSWSELCAPFRAPRGSTSVDQRCIPAWPRSDSLGESPDRTRDVIAAASRGLLYPTLQSATGGLALVIPSLSRSRETASPAAVPT
jgi:hypothetical protein